MTRNLHAPIRIWLQYGRLLRLPSRFDERKQHNLLEFQFLSPRLQILFLPCFHTILAFQIAEKSEINFLVLEYYAETLSYPQYRCLRSSSCSIAFSALPS